MRLERVRNINLAMKAICPDSTGYRIMRDKTQILAFKIQNLKLQAMNILKQDALSNNAELVTPKHASLCKEGEYDCLLLGTPKALKKLAEKMQIQPFGLKTMAQEINMFLRREKDYGRKIMGIINVDSESFYQEFNIEQALQKIHEYIELGIDIIDVGAASTRPGAKYVESEVELKRLSQILSEVRNIKCQTKFSIDTYNKATAQKALECGFSIINDISGKPESMIEALQSHPHASYILTHIQGTPLNMQENCNYNNLVLDIDTFFTEKIQYLMENECKNIILDVGIGFAKNMQQNSNLIMQLSHFKHFNLPLLIGASHKSFLTKILENSKNGGKILKENAKHKAGLPSTLIVHYLAWQHGANIIRVHDVEPHLEMLHIVEHLRTIDMDML